jgi:DNA-binding NtrC family response regulator
VRPAVLIVDDDDTVRDLLLDFLGARGYEAHAVGDAASALRRITESAPDVVLLDVQLPGLNGLVALPSIRALAPDTAVVMISGSTEPKIAEHALAFGAFDYVAKPIDFARLGATLDSAVALRRVQA